MPLDKQKGVRGSHYLSIRYTERLAEAGIEPSVGSVGDSYDNALAETINGLFKAEVIHRRGPWRSFDAVEFATLEWVDWFNNRRLLEPIGNIPPAEKKENFYAALERSDMAAQLRSISLRQTRCGSNPGFSWMKVGGQSPPPRGSVDAVLTRICTRKRRPEGGV